MRAIVCEHYDGPDVLQLRDVATPTIADREVLVRVLGAAVNPGDWFLLTGTPYLLRLTSGLRRPRRTILGLAVAGRVEAVGENVTRLHIGDEVFAETGDGGFAEHVGIAEGAVAPKPAGLTFEQAAAVPVCGVAALQALRDIGRVQPEQRVLVNGASGGVGTFAVQIAKALGAHVTGVCSTRNVDLVGSIGADHVVDYTRQDFTATGRRYDVILDNVGNRSLSACRRALAPNGTLIPNANRGGRWIGMYIARAARALAMSPFVSQRLRPFSSVGSGEDLCVLADFIEAGQVTPVIDRVYPLEATAEALRYYGRGHARGKVIIAV